MAESKIPINYFPEIFAHRLPVNSGYNKLHVEFTAGSAGELFFIVGRARGSAGTIQCLVVSNYLTAGSIASVLVGTATVTTLTTGFQVQFPQKAPYVMVIGTVPFTLTGSQ